MKQFSFLFLFVLLFSGCQKNDVIFIKGKLQRCEVSKATSPSMYIYRMVAGFEKTFNPNGLVKTLRTRISTNMSGELDSIKYEFTYSGNIVHVNASHERYVFEVIGRDNDLFFTGNAGERTSEEPTSSSFDIVIDEKTGNAISAGDMNFQYKNNRLTSFSIKGQSGIYSLVYDNRGNVIREPGGARYEYDYRKTAKQQLYFSTGTHEMYSLMEMLGLIPVAPNNLRTKYMSVTGDDPNSEYVLGSFEIKNHKINKDGHLTSYDINEQTVFNNWTCAPVNIIK